MTKLKRQYANRKREKQRKSGLLQAALAGVNGGKTSLGMFSNTIYYPKPPKVYKNKQHPGVRNSKILDHINMMYDTWRMDQFPSRVTKSLADPTSISSIKEQHGCIRNTARIIRKNQIQETANA